MWLNDGYCIRLRPERPGHVWVYDFVEGRTHDGRKFRILTMIDEASRECLALIVARQLEHEDVVAALANLFVSRGPPHLYGPTTSYAWICHSRQLSRRSRPRIAS